MGQPQSRKTEPRPRNAAIDHLVRRHQLLLGSPLVGDAGDDLMVDHQLAAGDAVQQARLRTTGGKAGRKSGGDLGAAFGQQDIGMLELPHLVGVDGDQRGHIVGVVGVELGLHNISRISNWGMFTHRFFVFRIS